jgi:type II secretion system protein N
MSERAKKILLYAVAAPLFFVLSLTCGAYYTFPYDHLRDYIVQEAERDGAMQLEIAEISPSWLTGVELEGVRFAQVPDDPGARPTPLALRTAEARVSMLSLLGGEVDVDYETEIEGGGTIEGNVAFSDTKTAVSAELDGVDLRRIGPLRDAIGLPIAGRASGTLELVAAQEAAQNQLDARITIRNVSIADGQTPFVMEGLGTGLTLERMNLGTLTIQMSTERGSGSIERLRADGEHAQLWGTGTIRPGFPLRMSSIDMLVRIKFKDAYRESSSRMGALMMLLDANPQIRPARTPDGALQWRVQGSFATRVRMTPSGRAPMPGAE